MKVFLKSSLAAAVLAVGVFSGCDLKIGTRQTHRVLYTQEGHSQGGQNYWVHEGRVYEGNGPENVYLFEGERRGPRVLDGDLRIRIQKDGRHYGSYGDADRNRHDNRGRH
jgi:hypothetical protein